MHTCFVFSIIHRRFGKSWSSDSCVTQMLHCPDSKELHKMCFPIFRYCHGLFLIYLFICLTICLFVSILCFSTHLFFVPLLFWCWSVLLSLNKWGGWVLPFWHCGLCLPSDGRLYQQWHNSGKQRKRKWHSYCSGILTATSLRKYLNNLHTDIFFFFKHDESQKNVMSKILAFHNVMTAFVNDRNYWTEGQDFNFQHKSLNCCI